MFRWVFVGWALYALQSRSFPAEQAVRAFEGVERPATAFLWGTFGTSLRGPKAYFRAVGDRSHSLEVYLSNGVCATAGNCQPGDGIPKQIRARVHDVCTRLRPLLSPNTTLLIAPALEDRLPAPVFRRWVKFIRLECPEAIVVRSPGFKHAQRATADLLEAHKSEAYDPSEVVVINDGWDLYGPGRTPDYSDFVPAREYLIANLMCGAQWVLLWNPAIQGIFPGGGTNVPPKKRTFVLHPGDVEFVNDSLRWAEREYKNLGGYDQN